MNQYVARFFAIAILAGSSFSLAQEDQPKRKRIPDQIPSVRSGQTSRESEANEPKPRRKITVEVDEDGNLVDADGNILVRKSAEQSEVGQKPQNTTPQPNTQLSPLEGTWATRRLPIFALPNNFFGIPGIGNTGFGAPGFRFPQATTSTVYGQRGVFNFAGNSVVYTVFNCLESQCDPNQGQVDEIPALEKRGTWRTLRRSSLGSILVQMYFNTCVGAGCPPYDRNVGPGPVIFEITIHPDQSRYVLGYIRPDHLGGTFRDVSAPFCRPGLECN